MNDSSSEKYLGDIIHKSGNQKANIEARIAKGKGIAKTITAMIQESPLGWSRVKAGLILREAMLINGIMFNAEAWHGVRQEDVDALEASKHILPLLEAISLNNSSLTPRLAISLGQFAHLEKLELGNSMFTQYTARWHRTSFCSPVKP